MTDSDGLFAAGFFGFMLFIFLIGIVGFVFWIMMIVDIVQRDFHNPNEKAVWLIVTVLLGVVGAIVYYFAGRQSGTLPSKHQSTPSHTPTPPAPVDDEPTKIAEATEMQVPPLPATPTVKPVVKSTQTTSKTTKPKKATPKA